MPVYLWIHFDWGRMRRSLYPNHCSCGSYYYSSPFSRACMCVAVGQDCQIQSVWLWLFRKEQTSLRRWLAASRHSSVLPSAGLSCGSHGRQCWWHHCQGECPGALRTDEARWVLRHIQTVSFWPSRFHICPERRASLLCTVSSTTSTLSIRKFIAAWSLPLDS